MNTFIGIFILIVFLFLIGLIESWRGKCKNCGSWRNWVNDYDSHKGDVCGTKRARCSKCGHREVFIKESWRGR
jgi:hypothetical protein